MFSTKTETIKGGETRCYCFHNIGFGYVNENAEVVIVGITPGLSQMNKADKDSDRERKRKHAFAGKMKKNLIEIFEKIGLNEFLKITSYDDSDNNKFWSEEFFSKVEMTSLLKEATFCNCRMFNDPTKIKKSEHLKRVFDKGFKNDCDKYKKAKLFIALGKKVKVVLEQLKNEGLINAPIIAIPHPSGANNGKVTLFLGDNVPEGNNYSDTLNECKDVIECIVKNNV